MYSAYSILDIEQGLKPIRFGKVMNEEMLKVIEEEIAQIKYFPIEMVASYGMPVGATVFRNLCMDRAVYTGCYRAFKGQPYICISKRRKNGSMPLYESERREYTSGID